MDQLVIVIFILGLIALGEKTQSPLYNIISIGFIFYLAFTISVPILMVVLIMLGIFQAIYIFTVIKK